MVTRPSEDSIVVCGSRDWPEDKLWFVTAKMIEMRPEGATVITGGARGVDWHAHTEAVRLRWPTLVIKADWERYGRRAGYLRNLAMLNEMPTLVLAFQWGSSKGTAHTVHEAHARGITVCHYTEASLRPDLAALDYDDEPIYLGRGRP